MKFAARRVVRLFLVGAAAVARAEDFRISCPPTFDPQAVLFAPTAVPSGWMPYMPGLLYVGNAAILYGPPATKSYSVPTSTTDGRRLDTTTWELADGEKWLSCGYGAGDELTLSAPLPRDITKCTARLEKDVQGNVTAVSVQCTRAARRQTSPG